jgi:hypothetical protein
MILLQAITTSVSLGTLVQDKGSFVGVALTDFIGSMSLRTLTDALTLLGFM